MEEINVKDNKKNLIIYINARPNINNIPEEILKLLVSDMEMKLRLFLNKKAKQNS